ncbi:MAG: hypothetical protein ABI640_22035 [Gammaproteobacteria bacterium]
MSLAALVSEAKALAATFAAMRHGLSLGNRPLVLLTAAEQMSADELAAMSMTPEQGRQKLAAWVALQDDEARWSTNSRHQLVPDASHYIQFDRPDVVARAVRDVVDSIRNSVPLQHEE